MGNPGLNYLKPEYMKSYQKAAETDRLDIRDLNRTFDE